MTGRGLANAYAQTLGTIFSSGGEKPYEVEIFVAEVGDDRAEDQIYRLTYDGSVADEHGFAVMGGQAELVETTSASTTGRPRRCRGDPRRRDALGQDATPPRTVESRPSRSPCLTRSRTQPRKFRRLGAADVVAALGT